MRTDARMTRNEANNLAPISNEETLYREFAILRKDIIRTYKVTPAIGHILLLSARWKESKRRGFVCSE